jgi:hypothetical protein
VGPPEKGKDEMMSRALASFGSIGLVMFGGALLTSCSDPVPPEKTGAVSYTISAPPTQKPDTHCSLGLDINKVGSVTGSTASPITEDQGTVDCAVTAAGAGFNFNGILAQGSQDGQVYFSVEGTADPNGPTQTTRISVKDRTTTATYQTKVEDIDQDGKPDVENLCVVTVTKTDSDPQLSVSAGRIWAKFSCPDITDPESSGTQCAVTEGYFVFENCAE